MPVAASKEMNAYFKQLQDEANRCYDIASEARKRGKDPELEVEIPQADDLASRVEMLLDLEGIASIIRETSKKHPNREVMSIVVAKRVAKEFKGPKHEALDKAVRVGLAVLTEGILVAPLDGIAEVKIHGEGNGSYASISFAGPIRSAGGTGQAMSVLIADVVRSELEIGPYEATPQEIERWKEEIPLYRRLVNLQYLPSDKEIEAIVGGCKVCVDGEGTEDAEISGYRDLPRMETNRVRGGACLVVAEGLALKAKKLKKHVKKLKIKGWGFLGQIVKDEGKSDDKINEIEPNFKFIKDMVAGRPVYSHPSTRGGFRLRYGRSRTAGLASISVNPAIMYIMQETLAVGTQIKIERPGKAGITTPCDRLDGPLVLMKNGDLKRIKTADDARNIMMDQIDRIVELGEILIPVGEFIENNHPLVPPAYDIGWYTAILDSKDIRVDDMESMDLAQSLELCEKHDVPLHPRHTFMWANMEPEDILEFRDWMAENSSSEEGKVTIPDNKKHRTGLMKLAVPYRVRGDILELEGAEALFPSLGIEPGKKPDKPPKGDYGPLELVSKLSGIRIMDRCGTFIGARMARPEKAAVRKMKPPVHGLFPVGAAGGPQRLLSKAAEGTGKYKVDLEERRCKSCGNTGFLPICGECGSHTYSSDRVAEQLVDAYMVIKECRNCLNLGQVPKFKGVQGMISKNKTPEMPEKGMLRAKHEVFVFKDGTSRFDCTDAPLTHFRPREIGTSVERLVELGYGTDIDGNPLESEEQMLEMRPQDIVLPDNGGDYLLKVSHFIDELLETFYGLEPFYNAKSRKDLVGAGLLGLSPHTSGGVLSRLIGFTRARVGYAHPFFHAAKRRNCDGDEDCFMLLMDGLLNFSVSYLPEKRGGRMDAPLVLMTRIDPNEIDKEAHAMDVGFNYKLEVYEGGLEYADPKDLEAKGHLDTVATRIGSNLQYESFGFTLDTADISAGPNVSSYKTLESMDEKTQVQLQLARLISAVDEKDVAERLLNNHFIPDMIGNLRTFSNQKVRCTKCNRKYRRMPLAGACKCGNKLTLTVHVASVMKYLEASKKIATDFDVSTYVTQRIDMLEDGMCSMFENDKVKDCKLSDFF